MAYREGRLSKNDRDTWEFSGVELQADMDVEIQVQGHWLKARTKHNSEDGTYFWLWLRSEPSPYIGQFAATLQPHGEMKIRIPA